MSNQTSGIILSVSLSHPRFAQEFFGELKNWLLHAPADIPLLIHAPSCVLPVSWSSSASSYIPLAHSLEKNQAQRSADTPEAGLSAADRDLLKEQLGSGRLYWLSAGFSGAVHPLLTPDEARLDAEWSRSNPWRSGYIDNFGNKGLIDGMLTPLYPDPLRLDARLACLRTWSRVGLGTHIDKNNLTWYYWASAHELENLPYLALNEQPSHWPGATSLAHQCAAYGEDLSTLVQVRYAPGHALLEHLLKLAQGLKAQGKVFESQVQTLARPSTDKPSFLPYSDFAYTPDMAMRLWSVTETRRSRSTVPERIKAQLFALRPDETGNAGLKTPKEDKRKKGLLAHMQGSALLMGEAFNAVFQDSQLVGLDRQEKRLLDFFTGDPPFLDWQNTRLRYERESAVSFETERAHGMRLALTSKHPSLLYPGKTSIDYFFIDDSPWLFVEITAKFPWFKDDRDIDCFVPYQLSVLLPAEADSLHTEWLQVDGRSLQSQLPIPELEATMAKAQQKEQARKNTRQKREQQLDSSISRFFTRLGELARSRVIDPLQTGIAASEPDVPAMLLAGWSWVFTPIVQGQQLIQQSILIRRLSIEKETLLPLECSLRRTRSGTVLQLRPEAQFRNVNSVHLRGVEQKLSFALCPAWALRQVSPPDSGLPKTLAPHQEDFSPFLEREIHPSSVWRQI